MFQGMSYTALAGQIVSLIALGFCIVGFASKRDDRLLVLLISANVAFALQFALFGSWTAAILSLLVIGRILLARRYVGNWQVMLAVLAVNLVAAVLTWRSPVDFFAIAAAVFGTLGMFMLRGIPMRLMLAAAAFAWMLNNIVIGSVGGTLAEAMVLVVNFITICRLARMKRRYPGALGKIKEPGA
ncbi:permease [Streptosporangium jomthongense]|uniref:YgjV family protein n=1 Tax=Marinobacter aromaticivorans TaxID=1494078 RepID=A0ABW2IRL4_9GAMM|nr:YgjV family protein [Marinobacter aromaticivorans]GGE55223.1 permease [Streptosporangium jomthongense]